jgi:hypothetical protein
LISRDDVYDDETTGDQIDHIKDGKHQFEFDHPDPQSIW